MKIFFLFKNTLFEKPYLLASLQYSLNVDLVKLLCNWKSIAGTDIRTPVAPPIVNVMTKLRNQIIIEGKRMRPRYIVKSQLNIFTPVGIAMTAVMMPKNAFTSAPAPIVKK